MKKAVVITIASALVLSSVTGLVFWKIKSDKEKKEQALLAELSSIQEQVTSLYTDGQKSLLSASIEAASIQQIKSLLQVYNIEKLSTEASGLYNQSVEDIEVAETMLTVQDGINSLFDETGEVWDGDDPAAYKKQLEALEKSKPDFVEQQSSRINHAEMQQEQILNASTMVDTLFANGDKSAVKETITKAEIQNAQAAIKDIRQVEAKTSLLAYIQVADVYLEAKLKAEAEAKAKAEAEAKAKAEAEAKAKAAAAAKKSNSGKGSSSKSKPDMSGWVPYSTGDPGTLLRYLASGDVVEYNGQYYASPDLVSMIANPEVVYIREIGSE
jgi:hypothetical protein